MSLFFLFISSYWALFLENPKHIQLKFKKHSFSCSEPRVIWLIATQYLSMLYVGIFPIKFQQISNANYKQSNKNRKMLLVLGKTCNNYPKRHIQVTCGQPRQMCPVACSPSSTNERMCFEKVDYES